MYLIVMGDFKMLPHVIKKSKDGQLFFGNYVVIPETEKALASAKEPTSPAP